MSQKLPSESHRCKNCTSLICLRTFVWSQADRREEKITKLFNLTGGETTSARIKFYFLLQREAKVTSPDVAETDQVATKVDAPKFESDLKVNKFSKNIFRVFHYCKEIAEEIP